MKKLFYKDVASHDEMSWERKTMINNSHSIWSLCNNQRFHADSFVLFHLNSSINKFHTKVHLISWWHFITILIEEAFLFLLYWSKYFIEYRNSKKEDKNIEFWLWLWDTRFFMTWNNTHSLRFNQFIRNCCFFIYILAEW